MNCYDVDYGSTLMDVDETVHQEKEERLNKAYEVGQLLIDLGAKADVYDVCGFSPLIGAIRTKNYKLAEALVKAGADVSSTRFTVSPLLMAARYGQIRIARMLLAAGAKPNNLLLEAIRTGDLKFVKRIHKCGVNLSAKLSSGVTILHLAVNNNLPKMVQLCLKLGVPVDCRTDFLYETPLHYAAEEGNLPIVKILLRHGANVNATDTRGWTPLRWAVSGSYKPVIRALTRAGGKMSTLP